MLPWTASGTVKASCAARPEVLYQVPAEFRNDLPLVTVQLTNSSSARSIKLLIDSGANRSFLFPGGAEGTSAATAKFYVRSGKSARSLGKLDFAEVTNSQMAPGVGALMDRLGVAGSIGDDFLQCHDVLIDFRNREVFVSDEIDDSVTEGPFRPSNLAYHRFRPAPRARRPFRSHAWTLDLAQQEERYFVAATVLANPPIACLLALDTGSGESALPSEIVRQLPPTGVRRRLVGFQGAASKVKEYRARIALAPGLSLSVRALGSDARGPILGSGAFADRTLFLQFRLARAAYD